MSQMIAIGSRVATSLTNSQRPRGSTSSRISSTSLRPEPSYCLIARGRNMLLNALRKSRCSSPSLATSIRFDPIISGLVAASTSGLDGRPTLNLPLLKYSDAPRYTV